MEKFLIGVVIFLTSVIQGIFGFAFVLVGMPLLSFFLNIKVAAPLLALFTVLITGIMTFRLKKKFDFKRVMPLFIGAVLGIPVGIFFLLKFSDNLIKSTLGVVLIVYSAYSLLIKRILCKLPRWTGYIFGFFAGALGGAFNTTGPPVVFYMSTQEWSKIEIVGSLNFFFFVTSVLVLVFHLGSGNITKDITLTFLELAPVMMIGMLLGTYIFRKMSEDYYRKGLFILLMVMGVVLII